VGCNIFHNENPPKKQQFYKVIQATLYFSLLGEGQYLFSSDLGWVLFLQRPENCRLLQGYSQRNKVHA